MFRALVSRGQHTFAARNIPRLPTVPFFRSVSTTLPPALDPDAPKATLFLRHESKEWGYLKSLVQSKPGFKAFKKPPKASRSLQVYFSSTEEATKALENIKSQAATEDKDLIARYWTLQPRNRDLWLVGFELSTTRDTIYSIVKPYSGFRFVAPASLPKRTDIWKAPEGLAFRVWFDTPLDAYLAHASLREKYPSGLPGQSGYHGKFRSSTVRRKGPKTLDPPYLPYLDHRRRRHSKERWFRMHKPSTQETVESEEKLEAKRQL